MNVEGQISEPEYLGADQSLDDPKQFPLTYHVNHHPPVGISQCEDENCKAYVRSIS